MDLIYTGTAPKKEISQIFVETMRELMTEDPKVVYIDADLMASMRSKELLDEFPKNVFNTGIQEANMVGVAAGMHLYGKKPYIHSFAPFAARRCYDQTFISIGYAHKGCRIIGSEPGICAADNGGTHMTFEDIALMRMIPKSVVVDISDGSMFRQILKQTKDMNGVIYIRTPRRGLPDLYGEDENFEIGHGKQLLEGNDCTVIASGIMVETAIKAAESIKENGYTVDLIDPVTIKPLDKDMIIKSAAKTGRVVTIENHSIYGGLGGAVCEMLSENLPVKVKRIGIDEAYGQVGSVDYLREAYKLTADDIVNQIMNQIEASR